MFTKEQIIEQRKEVFDAILETMKASSIDYCQSWWLNCQNFKLKSNLSTAQINQRAKWLVKNGYLKIDPKNTSTSRGTSYKLTGAYFGN